MEGDLDIKIYDSDFFCYGENYGDKDCQSNTPLYLNIFLMVQDKNVSCVKSTIL